MKIGVYAGSFDPITKGHQDIIERALKIVDKLIVVVMNNPKKNYWFNLDERKNLISKIFEGSKNIKVDEHAGLLVDFMAKNSCGILIKGLRDVKDFSEEMTYSFANKKLSNGEVDTIFIPTSEKYTYVSSTFVKELAFYNQSLAGYVDDKVIVDILNRAKEYRDRG
mgnify:FL=1